MHGEDARHGCINLRIGDGGEIDMRRGAPGFPHMTDRCGIAPARPKGGFKTFHQTFRLQQLHDVGIGHCCPRGAGVACGFRQALHLIWMQAACDLSPKAIRQRERFLNDPMHGIVRHRPLFGEAGLRCRSIRTADLDTVVHRSFDNCHTHRFPMPSVLLEEKT